MEQAVATMNQAVKMRIFELTKQTKEENQREHTKETLKMENKKATPNLTYLCMRTVQGDCMGGYCMRETGGDLFVVKIHF